MHTSVMKFKWAISESTHESKDDIKMHLTEMVYEGVSSTVSNVVLP